MLFDLIEWGGRTIMKVFSEYGTDDYPHVCLELRPERFENGVRCIEARVAVAAENAAPASTTVRLRYSKEKEFEAVLHKNY